jgi:hypothetical protein
MTSVLIAALKVILGKNSRLVCYVILISRQISNGRNNSD